VRRSSAVPHGDRHRSTVTCRAAVLLLFLAFGLTGVADAQEVTAGDWRECTDFRHNMWWNMDLPGSDFHSFRVPDPSGEPSRDPDAPSYHYSAAMECREACIRNERCQAWSFVWGEVVARDMGYSVGRDRYCYLKDSVPSPVWKEGVVASVKRPDRGPPTAEAAAVRSPRTAPAGMEARTNRPGADYRDFEVTGNAPAVCQSACQEDPRCRAWTVVRPEVQGPRARCWLKDAVPEPVTDACCVSGVKR
jgi:hypothetical protein